MNLTARAATQLRALQPDQPVAILDDLRQRPYGPGSHGFEVTTNGVTFRCFVARHRDGSLVLLGVVANLNVRVPFAGIKKAGW